MKNIFIESSFSKSLPTFAKSGVFTWVPRKVVCALDSNNDGISDGGGCSGFEVTCSTNFQSECNTGFSSAATGAQITDEDVAAFYSISNQVATNRNFGGVTKPTNVDDNQLIDDNDFDVLKNWVDSFPTFGVTQDENVGNVIDASGWISIRDRLKNVAKICNNVFHCGCNKVCTCDTVCTCNCNSNY